jgi:AraC-like DNA-binding protein
MSDSQLLNVDSRPSDSLFVETIWRSRSYQAGRFLSTASSHWEMIVSRYEGRLYLAIRGPETRPTVAHCPPDGEWLGIQFKHGVFMPHLPVIDLVDGGVELPDASNRSFWLHGSSWEFPTIENVDTFVARLVKEELLVLDPIVESTMQAHAVDLSPRSVQRRFLRTTGLTHGAISQIERAHLAVALLRQGVSILDTVERAGYTDQPHLTHSLKRFIGQTPTQLAPDSNAMPLSFSSVSAPAE